ncbi:MULTISPECIES: DUF2628 domain-containing protein [Pseudomonas syringae group]|uniref:DUF2628 domain-containing protein n=1 Tax=Pseudomonas syringae pv. maculicola TaxID=59511 RepID=A0A0N0G289_PSEYM|nr:MULTISPECIES: DUF2628 domain-containing protein [Pseudomonas syringae group]KPC08404.1 Uncharacterized protein AC503_5660 [Pseudomonas syringae pv. maculicola]KPC09553.1 Uncharacterized protein AC506_0684 [Pseudomonas syringae pv. maculicola str. M6]KPX68186.1 Uncharacterized protein ALO84_00025 [Pseudomonas syringae pv. maculicola]MBM0212468.1 DUF2628 domain-containing protein [Pseudomonas syringae pv. maculicola]QQN27543.1 DUF2628 domain-containing protein [Pseudomonas syringae pv. maculi
MNTSEPAKASGQYNDKWKERFAFFEAHGGPNAPGFRPALKQLPLLKKVKINFNVFAFFFGPVYLFILGLWKKNLSFIAMIVVVSFALDMVMDMFEFRYAKEASSALGFVFNALYGQLTNYAYYLKEVKGEHSWNPFQGLRW